MSPSPDLSIRLATFTLCTCPQFKHTPTTESLTIHPSADSTSLTHIRTTHPSSHHISLTTHSSPLSTTSSAAISYTWGAFHRRDVVVGHYSHDVDSLVTLNLGVEWDIPELLKRLSEVSAEYSGIWIDQLCIPQKEEEITSLLAAIPDIYRKLEVVVLTPGGWCGCIRQRLSEANISYDSTEEELTDEQAWDLLNDLRITCMNLLGSSNYYHRVWPRQEMEYATTLRLVWNVIGEEPAPCFDFINAEMDFVAEAPNLATHMRWATLPGIETSGIAEDDLEGRETAFDTYIRIIEQNARFQTVLIREVGGPGRINAKKIIDFLSGKRVGNGWRKYESVEEGVEKFTSMLFWSSEDARQATKARDYVLSIWPSLPGYMVPKGHKTMGLGRLLEEAVKGVEERYGATLGTLTPDGLFGGGEGWLWRAGGYMSEDVESTMVVYGYMSSQFPLKVVGGRIPLLRLESGKSITTRAVSYKHDFGTATAFEAYKAVKPVMENITNTASLRLDQFRLKRFTPELLRAMEAKFRNLGEHLEDQIDNLEIQPAPDSPKDEISIPQSTWLDFVLLRSISTDQALTFSFLPDDVLQPILDHESDHQLIIQDLVCYLLGVDPDLCRRKELEVVITQAQPAIIGLRRKGFSKDDGGEYITVDMAETKVAEEDFRLFGWRMVEGRRVEGGEDNEKRYEVVGTWVACIDVGDSDIGAMAMKWDRKKGGEDVKAAGWLV